MVVTREAKALLAEKGRTIMRRRLERNYSFLSDKSEAKDLASSFPADAQESRAEKKERHLMCEEKRGLSF